MWPTWQKEIYRARSSAASVAWPPSVRHRQRHAGINPGAARVGQRSGRSKRHGHVSVKVRLNGLPQLRLFDLRDRLRPVAVADSLDAPVTLDHCSPY